jgi:hypothetical protein
MHIVIAIGSRVDSVKEVSCVLLSALSYQRAKNLSLSPVIK